MTDWQEVRSSAPTKPSELDLTSSSYVVYERKNIREENVTDPLTEQEYKEWVYEERIYPVEEYKSLNSSAFQLLMQNLSDLELGIAEISLMAEV